MLMSLTTLRPVGSPVGADVLSELKNNPPSLTLKGESVRGMITAAQISESHFISMSDILLVCLTLKWHLHIFSVKCCD